MKRLELLGALKKVMPGVEEKTTLLEGANSFMFDGSWIKTFNDVISVSYPFESGIKALVKAAELFKILSKLDAEDVKMVALDEGKFQLSSGRMTLKMAGQDVTKFSSLVDNLALDTIKWTNLPADFSKALALTATFATRNSCYPTLCGVSVGSDGMAASDKIRAGFYSLNIKAKDDFVIPTRAAIELTKIPELVAFSIAGSWLHFKDKEGLCFSVRKMDVEFPREKIKQFVEATEGLDEHTFPEDLAKAIDAAAVIAYATEDGQQFVEISTDAKGNMVVSGTKDAYAGAYKIPKDGKWSFPAEVKLKVNPSLFSSILSLGNKFFTRDDAFLYMNSGSFKVILSLIRG